MRLAMIGSETADALGLPVAGSRELTPVAQAARTNREPLSLSE